MGLSDSDEIHPVLGNVKQALEALVQQRLGLYDWVDFLLRNHDKTPKRF
jgi:hypothetical protein